MDIDTTIAIPFIRTHLIDNLVSEIHANAGVDRDQYEVLAEEDTERIGCPKMLARLVAKSCGQKILFIGDDCSPQPGFLKKALAAMRLLPEGWGLVGLNDLTGRTLPTHWLADKRLLPEIGGEFFHAGYSHCFCDNELMERAQALGRFIYAHAAVVIHRHPLIHGTGGQWDDDYRRVYSPAVFEHDKALFEERRPSWQ